jgi:bis(5'-adenosyl)-triphosphatase
VHVIPRIKGSTAKPAETPSDAIYDHMAAEEGNVGGALWDRHQQGEYEYFEQEQQQQHQHQDKAEAGGEGVMMRERPQPGGRFPSIEDAGRRARSMGEMEEEAGVYKGVLERMDAMAEEGGR